MPLALGIVCAVVGYTTTVWGYLTAGRRSQSFAYLIGASQDATVLATPMTASSSPAGPSDGSAATSPPTSYGGKPTGSGWGTMGTPAGRRMNPGKGA